LLFLAYYCLVTKPRLSQMPSWIKWVKHTMILVQLKGEDLSRDVVDSVSLVVVVVVVVVVVDDMDSVSLVVIDAHCLATVSETVLISVLLMLIPMTTKMMLMESMESTVCCYYCCCC